MTDASTIELDVQRVIDLLEAQDRFLRMLQDLAQGKIAEAERAHLTLVASEDDEGGVDDGEG